MLLWTARGSGLTVDPQRWEDPDGKSSVTLDPEVMTSLTREVLEGFLALPKRGLEVGGLLLGRVDGSPHSLLITGFEAVPCEHRFGPSYTFSDHDAGGLRAMLASLREQGSNPVGWYRSYTGREMAMDDHDRQIIEEHFADRDIVYLLIRPVTTRECVVDVAFVKTARPGWTPPEGLTPVDEPPPPEPLVRAGIEEPRIAPVEPPAWRDPAPAPVEEPQSHAAPPAPIDPEPVAKIHEMPRPGASLQAEIESDFPLEETPVDEPLFTLPQERTRSSRWLWAAFVLALAAGGFAAYQWWQLLQTPVASDLGLDVESTSNGWLLKWDASRSTVRQATGGALAVTAAGATNRILLDADAIRSGSFAYSSGNAGARVQLALESGGRQYFESIRVLDAAPPPPPLPARRTPGQREPAAVAAVAAEPLSQVQPTVPDGVRGRIDGRITVELKVYVTAAGAVTRVVPQSQGDSLHQYVTLQCVLAVRKWRFRPARDARGNPVPSNTILTFAIDGLPRPPARQ